MPMSAGPGEAIVREFTGQADAFARAAVYQLAATLESLLAAAPLHPDQSWLDVACGPGIVTCALARRVAQATGVDLTPAMIERAAADAAAAGLANTRFLVGDAAALPCPAGTFDGALTRFSLHHIPAPLRVVREMARVVRPGGHVVVGDHLTCEEAEASAWHHDVERLRDPTHWLSPTPGRFFALGARAGLRLVSGQILPYDLDFEEWLTRGSGGEANRALITDLLAATPPAAREVFGLVGGRVHMQLGIAVWRVLPHTEE